MQQQMSLDILPPGAAESYEQYLRKIKDTMEHLVGQTEEVASVLDGHDRNTFTETIQEVLGKLAAQARTTADSTREVTGELLQKLEEKNENVGSSTQADYIEQIRTAAMGLDELETYRDCELSGLQAFTEEDKEEVADGLQDLRDEWEEAVRELKTDAQEFSEENVQNELSGIYLLLAEQMEQLLQKVDEIIEPVGQHLANRSESVSSRRTAMEQQAEQLFSEALAAFQRELEDAAETFTGIDF